jgi:hypothetical protein
MQRLTKFALRHVPSLVICLLSFGGLCFAQEVDVPSGRGSGSVVAPTGWAELIATVQKRVDLKLYGFYIGELEAPSAQVDVTVRATKSLTIIPAISITRFLQAGLMNSRMFREDLLAVTTSNNFGSTGRLCSRSTSLKSPSATCMSEGFFQHTFSEGLFQQKRSTAIAIGSRSRIPRG